MKHDPKDVKIKYLEGRIGILQTIIENLKSWVYQRIDETIPDDILNESMVYPNLKECTVSLEKLSQKIADHYLQNQQKNVPVPRPRTKGRPNLKKIKIKQISPNNDIESDIKQEQELNYEGFIDGSAIKEDIIFQESLDLDQSDDIHQLVDAEQLIPQIEFSDQELEDSNDDFNFSEFFNQNEQKPTDQPLNCKFCNKKFKSFRSKKIHEISHSRTQEYICDYNDCGRVFYHSRNLYWHKRGAHKVVKKSNTTDYEKGDTSTSNTTPTPLPRSSIVNVKKQDVNDDYSQRDDYYTIVEDTSTDTSIPKKLFKCIYSDCGKQYKDKKSIMVHNAQVHERKYEIHCSYCQKVVYHPRALEWHIRASHDKIRRNRNSTNNTQDQEDNSKSKLPSSASQICYICGKSYTRARYIREHIKICHSQAQEKVLNDEEALLLSKPKTRYRNRYKEPRVCPICGLKISLSSTYFTHMKIHNNERNYKCDVCFRGFNNSSHLQYHRETHFPPSVKCEYDDCTKKFYRVYNMQIHMKTVHSQDTPFDCTVCHLKFKIKRQLTIHQNKSGHLNDQDQIL